MQCYECQMMLAHINDVLGRMNPQCQRDAFLCCDILEALAVQSFEDLLKVDEALIRQIAAPHVGELKHAA